MKQRPRLQGVRCGHYVRGHVGCMVMQVRTVPAAAVTAEAVRVVGIHVSCGDFRVCHGSTARRGGAPRSRRRRNSKTSSHRSCASHGSASGPAISSTRSSTTRTVSTHARSCALHHACIVGCQKLRRSRRAGEELRHPKCVLATMWSVREATGGRVPSSQM